MGLLNKASAGLKKDEDRGEGLLSKASRFAGDPRGAEDAEDRKGGAQAPEDIEKETEDERAPPPPRTGDTPAERKGLLGRALAVSEERPAEARLSRRERRRAERAARGRGALAAEEPLPGAEHVVEGPAEAPFEAPIPDETSFAETAPAGEVFQEVFQDLPSAGDLSLDEEIFTEQAEQPGFPEQAAGPSTEPPAEIPPAADMSVEQWPVVEEFAAGFPGDAGEDLAAGAGGETPEEFPPGEAGIEAPEWSGIVSDEAAAQGKAAAELSGKTPGKPSAKSKKGLLAAASLFADRGAERGRVAGRERRGAGPAAKPPAPRAPKKVPRVPSAKAEPGETRAVKILKGRLLKVEERETVREAAVEEREIVGAPEEAVPAGQTVSEAERAEELSNFARTLESHLARRDALAVLDLFNTAVAREGYTSFILRFLETMCSLGKGKSGVLFAPAKERYTVELQVPPTEKQTKLKNAGVRQDSRFVQALKTCEQGFYRPGGGKSGQLKKETSSLGSLSPWAVAPLAMGNELVAFVVVGKQPERPKTNEGAVALLARLAAPYVGKYLLLKEHRFALSSLEKGMKEKDSLHSLASAFENPKEKPELPERCVREMLEGVAASLGIGSAVVLADWRPASAAGAAHGAGSYVPVASIGVPERAISRYKVSMKDREIASIVESGLPSVPCDAVRRIETLSRYASPKSGGRRGGSPGASLGQRPRETGSAPKWPRCFVVAPLLFNGTALGLLAVHDMKGAGKTLARDAAERIRQASRALVPALLYGKLHSMSPFGVARELVASQMDETKRSGGQLAVAVFTLENAKKACGELGFDKYWGIVERLRRLLENAAGDRGVVKEADWNRLFLFLRERGDNEVDELIARVRTGFSGGLKKSERESGIALATQITRYPRDSKSVEDILLSVM